MSPPQHAVTCGGLSLIDNIMLFAWAQKCTLRRISVKVPASGAEASLPEERTVTPTLPVPARVSACYSVNSHTLK